VSSFLTAHQIHKRPFHAIEVIMEVTITRKNIKIAYELK